MSSLKHSGALCDHPRRPLCAQHGRNQPCRSSRWWTPEAHTATGASGVGFWRTHAGRARRQDGAQAPGAQLGALLHQPVGAAALERAARRHDLPARALPGDLRAACGARDAAAVRAASCPGPHDGYAQGGGHVGAHARLQQPSTETPRRARGAGSGAVRLSRQPPLRRPRGRGRRAGARLANAVNRLGVRALLVRDAAQHGRHQVPAPVAHLQAVALAQPQHAARARCPALSRAPCGSGAGRPCARPGRRLRARHHAWQLLTADATGTQAGGACVEEQGSTGTQQEPVGLSFH